jgi:hypothetical protein
LSHEPGSPEPTDPPALAGLSKPRHVDDGIASVWAGAIVITTEASVQYAYWWTGGLVETFRVPYKILNYLTSQCAASADPCDP